MIPPPRGCGHSDLYARWGVESRIGVAGGGGYPLILTDQTNNKAGQVASCLFKAALLALLISPAVATVTSGGAGPQRLTAEGERELRGIVSEGRLQTLRFGEYQAELGEFYRSEDYTLAWVRDSRPTAKARAVIKLLQAADEKGLIAREYEGPFWKRRLAALSRPHRPSSERELLRFDLALTVCAMRYVTDLHLGRINPRKPRAPRLWDILRERIVPAQDTAAALSALEPPFPPYRRLIAAVQRYNDLARQDDGELLPVSTTTIKAGDRYSGTPRLTRLLRLLGDLPSGISVDPNVYAEPLVKAVKRFQRRHGLAPDGFLDPQTVRQLNTPLSQRLSQLRLALERWRWLPREFSRPPVIVNIPEFRLYAGDAPPQRVVVGMAFAEKETPVFTSVMTEVVFHPPWTVPISIQKKELVAKIAKNPSTYLRKNNFEVIDRDDAVVATGAVSKAVLEKLRQGRLYLRQKPGPDNSLGAVKFYMPNAHSVYIHGTPSRRGFEQSRRDLSHSCIRVENPEALAVWALRGQPEWTPEHIRAAIEGKETIAVKVTEPIPVLLQYGTAVVEENGEVRFFDDIYGRDAAEGASFERARAAR